MVKKDFIIPDRGDIVWINFSPTKGREQSGLRPAVVISKSKYASIAGLVLVCPVTSKSKGYLFEVPISGLERKSFALSDQLRTFDIKERIQKITGKIAENEMNEILARAATLLQ